MAKSSTKTVAGGLMAALAAFAARSIDDCGRIGMRAASSGADDVVAVGARGADDLLAAGAGSSDDLVAAGLRGSAAGVSDDALGRAATWGETSLADDIADLGAAPPTHLRPPPPSGALAELPHGAFTTARSVGHFGGSAFRHAALPVDPVARARWFGVRLTDDELEALTDVVLEHSLDAQMEALDWMLADLPGDDYTVFVDPDTLAPPQRVHPVAVAPDRVLGSEATVRTFAALDDLLTARAGIAAIIGHGRTSLRAAEGEVLPIERLLVRCAALGRACVVVAVDSEEPSHLAHAIAAVRDAAQVGPAGFSDRLPAARNRLPNAGQVSLHRLRHTPRGVQVVRSPRRP